MIDGSNLTDSDDKKAPRTPNSETNCTSLVTCHFNGSIVTADHQVAAEEGFYYVLLYFLGPGVFGVFTVVGIVGNALVVYVIVSDPRMRSVTNLLLLNLAGADVAFLFFCGPFTAYKYYAEDWVFGDLPCQMVQYLLYVSAYVTIYTLVAVSVHRYVTVSRPTSAATTVFRSGRNAVAFIVCLWSAVLVANVPTLTAHKTKEVHNYRYCGIEADSIKPLFVTFFVFGYAVPLSTICLLYVLIIRYLSSQKLATLARHQRTVNRKSRTCRVVVSVVVVFGISWLPHHVNSLVALFGTLPDNRFYQVLRVLWSCMVYSNSCVNPFIYNWMSEDFRSSFCRAIGCQCIIRRKTENQQRKLASIENHDRQTEETKALK